MFNFIKEFFKPKYPLIVGEEYSYPSPLGEDIRYRVELIKVCDGKVHYFYVSDEYKSEFKLTETEFRAIYSYDKTIRD